MATDSLHKTTQEKLAVLRRQIDAVDEQLIDLLKERIEIVNQVAELKRADGSLQCFIRSGREADILRDIYQQFDGSKFHPEAACAMWRLIISASTQHESAMRLLTPQKLEAAAKSYFGDFMPVAHTETVDDALAVLAKEPNALMVLPHWQADASFWREFAAKRPQSLRVFAAIPFVGKEPQAFIAANLMPEPSRDDISLFMDEDGKISSRDGYHTESPLAKYWLGTYARPIEGTPL